MFGKQSSNYERERLEKKREAIFDLFASISRKIMAIAMVALFLIWVTDKIEIHFLWIFAPIPIAMFIGFIAYLIINKTVKY